MDNSFGHHSIGPKATRCDIHMQSGIVIDDCLSGSDEYLHQDIAICSCLLERTYQGKRMNQYAYFIK